MNVSLYANPHLPPSWSGLTINGVMFQGHAYNIDIKSNNSVIVTKVS
jgi:hypothetical protein